MPTKRRKPPADRGRALEPHIDGIDAFAEMLEALKGIVRPSGEGAPYGHDAVIRARSVVRRVDPEWYEKYVTARRRKRGLPETEDAARPLLCRLEDFVGRGRRAQAAVNELTKGSE
jgi:hypothetical protein